MLEIIINIIVLKFEIFINIFSFAQEERIFKAINHPLPIPTNNGSLTAIKNLELIKAFPLRLETQNSAFWERSQLF